MAALPPGRAGSGADRSVGRPGWLGRALKEYRVLLLDQRGTGHSTPANRQTLPLCGGPAEQAGYLTHFRADSIVRDCEAIRAQVTGGAPWAVLGQSFGGFCLTTYLSLAPEGLATAVITGGLPSLDAHADDVYRAAFPRIERKVTAHYARYPQDAERARRIADHLLTHDVVLPNGYRLTVEAFQSLGIVLGTGDGTHRLHYLLENAFVRTPQGFTLSDAFQEQAQGMLSYARHPLYALVHEAIYGQDARPTAWSAERVRAEFPQFDAAKALAGDEPLLFTGESIHPWMFDCDPALRPCARPPTCSPPVPTGHPLRPGPPRRERRPGRRRRLPRRHVRGHRPLPADRPYDPRPAHVGHGRVRARRRAHRRRAGPGPAAGARAERGVMPCRTRGDVRGAD
ncbi:hypothetical protein SAFG77S_11910 [Streptomyces afghaniensis]